MLDRFLKSCEVVAASAAILRANKRLLLFPALSGACTLIVALAFLKRLLSPEAMADDFLTGHLTAGLILSWFAFYFALYLIITFFNSALVAAALESMDGADPTLASGIGTALSRLPSILAYAAIAATVGMLLNVLEECGDFLFELLSGLLGVTWSVITFLAVPVLVSEGVGPLEVLGRSAELARRTWGENLFGNIRIGFVFGLLALLILIVGAALLVAQSSAGSNDGMALVIFLGILSLLVLALVQSALHAVYSAALYRYAEEGIVREEFADTLTCALRDRE